MKIDLRKTWQDCPGCYSKKTVYFHEGYWRCLLCDWRKRKVNGG